MLSGGTGDKAVRDCERIFLVAERTGGLFTFRKKVSVGELDVTYSETGQNSFLVCKLLGLERALRRGRFDGRIMKMMFDQNNWFDCENYLSIA